MKQKNTDELTFVLFQAAISRAYTDVCNAAIFGRQTKTSLAEIESRALAILEAATPDDRDGMPDVGTHEAHAAAVEKAKKFFEAAAMVRAVPDQK